MYLPQRPERDIFIPLPTYPQSYGDTDAASGKSGVDLPMRIAERLAKLRLEDATASVGETQSKVRTIFEA